MSTTTHTPGPWTIRRHTGSQTIHIDAANGDPTLKFAKWRGLASVYGSIDFPDKGRLVGMANARLIASAPDHALICWALINGIARWEPFGRDPAGEFCIKGMRYATVIDEFGCPEMTPEMREAINEAKGGAS